MIGWPVDHSRSPAIHNAAYEALGVDMAYVAFPVPPGEAADAVAAMRSLGLRGLSVTMPHKEAVIDVLDEVSDAARLLSAVNCITNDGGRLIGDNTDGEGFLVGLEHETGRRVAGLRVAIVGAGGAARAIVAACAADGAASVLVVNRDAGRADSAAALAGPVGRVASIADLADVDLVVNATPVGMAGSEGAGQSPVDVRGLSSGTTVVDIVYEPRTTPLLAAAHAAGLPGIGGLPMLAGQAAAQIQRWTDRVPPLDLLMQAAAGTGT